MQIKSTGIIIALGLILIFLIVYTLLKEDNPCRDRISYAQVDLNQIANLDELFAPPTKEEIKKTISDWASFDLQSDSIQLIEKYFLWKRNISVLAHYKNGVIHYGAVILPKKTENIKKYPTLIWANGLNQFSQSVSLTSRREIKELCQSLPNHFIIIPSFRGQSLEISGHYFCSDVFFGDAFDGATDDALRLYHAAKQTYPQISKKTAIYGVSRGGTVALLAGIRHPDIQTTISQAGPTNFLGKEYYDRYGKQYKYQFLSQTTNQEEIRSKLLQSSPVHFIDQYDGKLFLLHGRLDKTVSIDHARSILKKVTTNELDSLITNSGHNAYHVSVVVNYIEKYDH
tara:strand:+ start:3654 stop:4679 length:1026 start_codon:yes stop_codon:yes gene_type:complete